MEKIFVSDQLKQRHGAFIFIFPFIPSAILDILVLYYISLLHMTVIILSFLILCVCVCKWFFFYLFQCWLVWLLVFPKFVPFSTINMPMPMPCNANEKNQKEMDRRRGRRIERKRTGRIHACLYLIHFISSFSLSLSSHLCVYLLVLAQPNTVHLALKLCALHLSRSNYSILIQEKKRKKGRNVCTCTCAMIMFNIIGCMWITIDCIMNVGKAIRTQNVHASTQV